MTAEEINGQALAARQNAPAREKLIRSQKRTILRVASIVSRKFVNESDDEWSVALCAFSEAVDRYDADAGDFLPFAKTRIRQALVDDYRSRARSRQEEPDDGTILNVIPDEKAIISTQIQDEIRAANEMLQEYGFRFMDLADACPKQERSRAECAQAVRTLLASPEQMQRMRIARQLNLRWLQQTSGVSRKALDRYRRYIIMASLILSDDYPFLSEYLQYIREVRQ